MFAALCENKDFFKDKINLAIMLAPVARVDKCSAKTIQDMANKETVAQFIESIGPELLPTPNVDGKIASGFMKITGASQFSIQAFSDSDPTLVSEKGLENYMGHFPSGTSYRCVNHFRQEINAKTFQKYDFGLEENIKRYDQAMPPPFDFAAMEGGPPIALFCGMRDQMASPGDYIWLKEKLVKNKTCVFFKEYGFGHIAFLFPPVKKHFYEMLELCRQFNSYYQPRPMTEAQNREKLLELEEISNDV